jgi:hypothetical protein
LNARAECYTVNWTRQSNRFCEASNQSIKAVKQIKKAGGCQDNG